MVSYDVEALFTSVPVKPAIAIIQKKLEAHKDLHHRTTTSPKQITSLLEFCLTSTYFTYEGKFYEQTDGTAIGSPISPNSGKPLYGGFGNQSPGHITTSTITMEEVCG